MYRVVFVLLVLALLLPGTASAQGPPDLSFHEVYEAVQKGLLLLTSEAGSCSAWRDGNLVVTCYHCVVGRTEFEVWHPAIGRVDPRGLTIEDRPKPSGRPDDMWVGWQYELPIPHGLPARVIGIDPGQDVAILIVNDMPDSIASLPMADAKTIQVGDIAFVMGWPFGLWPSFNMGIISALDVPWSNYFSGEHENMFVADMWVNKGNSGGPVLNIRGEVIGLASKMIGPWVPRGFPRIPAGINGMVNVQHIQGLIDSMVAYDKFTGRNEIRLREMDNVEPEPESEAGILDQIGGWRDVMPH